MSNELWRINSETMALYVEDAGIRRKIKRSHTDFTAMAQYYKDGELLAVQYSVPEKRRRAAKRLITKGTE